MKKLSDGAYVALLKTKEYKKLRHKYSVSIFFGNYLGLFFVLQCKFSRPTLLSRAVNKHCIDLFYGDFVYDRKISSWNPF